MNGLGCPKCAGRLVRADDGRRNDYECFNCSFAVGLNDDGTLDFRTQQRLEELQKRNITLPVKTVKEKKTMTVITKSARGYITPSWQEEVIEGIEKNPAPADRPSPDPRAEGLAETPENITKNMPDSVTSEAANALPPVPPRPEGKTIITKRYYEDNKDLIITYIKRLGLVEALSRWKISHASWQRLRSRWNLEGIPQCYTERERARAATRHTVVVPVDLDRIQDALEKNRANGGYPAWEAVKGESDQVKVAWLANYAAAGSR